MKKRGQITLFVILGIVLLVIVSLFLFVFKDINSSKVDLNLFKSTDIKEAISNSNSYLKTCLDAHYSQSIESLLTAQTTDINVYLLPFPMILIDDMPVNITKKGIAGALLTNPFPTILEAYRPKLQIIMQNANCLNDIPEMFDYLNVNPDKSRVEVFVGDDYSITTFLDGEITFDGSTAELKPITNSYGPIYAEDFNTAFYQLVLSLIRCDPDAICISNDVFDLGDVTVKYMHLNSDSPLIVRVFHDLAEINDEPVILNVLIHRGISWSQILSSLN